MKPVLALVLALLVARGPAAAGAAPDAPALPADSIYRLDGTLTDQDGKDFALADGRGRPRVVTMFYASCRFICPLIVDSAKGIDRGLAPAERERLGYLLVSIDPARDDPAALKEVADTRGLPAPRWTLARAETGTVRRLAAVLGVRYRELADGEFNHNAVLVLLDRDGRIAARTETLGAKPDPAFMAAVKAAVATPAAD